MLTQLTPQSTLTEVNLGSYLLGAASITEILPAHGFLPIGFWHPTPWFVSVDFGLCMARFLHVLAWPCLYWIRVTHLWPEPDGVFAVCVGLYPHELLAVLAILCTLRVYSTHLWSKPRWSCICRSWILSMQGHHSCHMPSFAWAYPCSHTVRVPLVSCCLF